MVQEALVLQDFIRWINKYRGHLDFRFKIQTNCKKLPLIQIMDWGLLWIFIINNTIIIKSYKLQITNHNLVLHPVEDRVIYLVKEAVADQVVDPEFQAMDHQWFLVPVFKICNKLKASIIANKWIEVKCLVKIITRLLHNSNNNWLVKITLISVWPNN